MDGDSGDYERDDCDEKNGKKNDWDEVDRLKQEVDSKGNVMHVEMSDCDF